MPPRSKSADPTFAAGVTSSQLSEEDFAARYPLTYQAMQPFVGRQAPVLKIVSRQDGFRRAGLVHMREAAFHEVAVLSPDQIERLLSEPMLVAEVIERPDDND
ncbi:hypothetical protein SAMN05880590_1328 [Rhizobium sp. RU35A]|uniref:HI1506-related protein n=1 Tax=Rhizobium sp. RU35A TaxID=1907414 RepID=UPI0009542F94|nr:HI1506-related protein [Rhizobium sp. RU35A]SIR43151.1 hypothetical protein SAMN05880590_1328 [Rhizobium sp. RU35A]